MGAPSIGGKLQERAALPLAPRNIACEKKHAQIRRCFFSRISTPISREETSFQDLHPQIQGIALRGLPGPIKMREVLKATRVYRDHVGFLGAEENVLWNLSVHFESNFPQKWDG